jgi:hypothetical protein
VTGRGPLAPPSGHPPPDGVEAASGQRVALRSLAEEICSRYRAEFPDERERYGEAGIAWCVHDNQHILNWAFLDERGFVDLSEQVAWLGRVLGARGFPLERLARNLELAAEVVEGALGDGAARVVARLRDEAAGLAAG